MKSIILIILLLIPKMKILAQCTEQFGNNLRKTAIVFGEKKYKYADTLNNTINDAEDITITLKRLNFEVFTYTNNDLRTMSNAIDDWCSKLENYDVALFYYSGHGIEAEGENYIIPIDANPLSARDLRFVAYPIERILDRMDVAKIKISIMILDACRNNPFSKSWKIKAFSNESGLATIPIGDFKNGAFIGYAAQPKHKAFEGSGRNSTYTEGILKYIESENQTIDEIFTKVSAHVKAKSNGSQISFKNSSLDINFCFNSKLKSKGMNTEDQAFANNIRSLLYKIEFNSSVKDVLLFEHGDSTLFSYDSLPKAIECTDQDIRYYWLYLNESKIGYDVNSYLYTKGLIGNVSPASYIIYGFKDDKLVRISLRIFPLTYDFSKLLFNYLGQNTDTYPERYDISFKGFHYTSGTSFTDINSTEIMISNDIGYHSCIHDWWHHRK